MLLPLLKSMTTRLDVYGICLWFAIISFVTGYNLLLLPTWIVAYAFYFLEYEKDVAWPTVRIFDFVICFMLRGQIHREGKPAVYSREGLEYILFGKYHRIEGPAVVGSFGIHQYHLFGAQFDKEDFDRLTSSGDELDIACKVYLEFKPTIRNDQSSDLDKYFARFFKSRGKMDVWANLSMMSSLVA